MNAHLSSSFDVCRGITRCAGILTDGDLAIKWNDDSRSRANHRSVSLLIHCLVRCSFYVYQGTLPFISSRLLSEWCLEEEEAPKSTHTAIDDLESFLWVLVWIP